MKLILLFKISILCLIVLAMTGCFPDNDSSYKGGLQVEFRPTEHTIDLTEDLTYVANIQLIGPHQDAAITLGYEIDYDQSTAILGEHYELSGNNIVIPANSSFGEIQFTAIPEAFDEDSHVLVISLTNDETGEVTPAQNYKTLELTFSP